MSPPTNARRRLAAATIAVAAALIAWGAMAPAWWATAAGPIRFAVGLRAMWICKAGGCHGRSLAELGGDLHWARVGRATFAAGLLTAALLAVAAALTAVRGGGRAAGLVCRMGAAGALFSLSLAVAFVAIHPASLGNLAVGYATAGFFAGGALGAFGSLLGARSV